MITQSSIRKSDYHDSVTLLGVAQSLVNAEGVRDAAVVMGTPANKELLESAHLLTEDALKATPNDLVIVVSGASISQTQAALEMADRLLKESHTPGANMGDAPRPRTLSAALDAARESNIVLVSVAGRYAAPVAFKALENNRHVFLFSDNVSLKDEIRLKETGSAQNLLVMGPDAGTAIINGAALGFANHVLRGPVGVVAASGTGLQAVTSELSNQGVGISQAIGIGGRDLSEAVGGIMMEKGYQALQADPKTDVIVLVSKPPAPKVAKKILKLVSACDKPTVVCFLGSKSRPIRDAGGVPAATLEEAALLASAIARGKKLKSVKSKYDKLLWDIFGLAEDFKSRINPGQKYYKGLFSGGTFCYEAQLILGVLLGKTEIQSNAPVNPEQQIDGAQISPGHTAIDLGADEFTIGRLHPMLDPTLRNKRLLQEALDPGTAVVYIDFVLGYGVHPDPAGAVIPTIRKAQDALKLAGRQVIFTASVCGTPHDPQDANLQIEKLKQAGIVVLPSNASAAYFAGYLLS